MRALASTAAVLGLSAVVLAQGGGWRAKPDLVARLAAQRPGINYDEARVPAYTLPDLLTSGTRSIKKPAQWTARRDEILELFRDNVYGRSPGRPEHLAFSVIEENPRAMDGAATLRRVGIVSRQPVVEVARGTETREAPGDPGARRENTGSIRPTSHAERRDASPVATNGEDEVRSHRADDARKRVVKCRGISTTGCQAGRTHQFELTLFLPNRPGPAAVFLLINNRPASNTDPTRQEKSGFWPAEQLIARGYGIAAIQYGQLAPDDKDTFRNGVIGLFDGSATGQPPYTWGALAAWGWGASRVMDYLGREPRVDASRVALVGHSRGGKAALWAGAEDPRFAMVVSNESGEGGAALSRRSYGETVERINTAFPHWFTATYQAFNGREAALPVDQHMLLASIAPRALYVASADEDLWADPRGEFLSLAASSPAFGLFGDAAIAPDAMPPLDTPLVVGRRGYHVRAGGHDLTPYDWDRFADFADRVWRQ